MGTEHTGADYNYVEILVGHTHMGWMNEMILQSCREAM